MSNIKLQNCPVCNETHFQTYLQLKDFSISKEDFTLMECKGCGFIFTDNFPDENSITPYYKSEDYISHSDTQKGLVNRIYHIVRAVMLQKKAQMVETMSAKRKGSLLDIGTGLAYFPQLMQSRGWQVEGIEQDADARQAAAQRFDFVVNDTPALLEMKGRNFDVVTMWHVLEHVHQLDSYMQTIKENLADDGLFVVAIPNPGSPDAEHYKQFWAAYDVPRHLWHWKPEVFKKFALKHGFEVVATKPMPMDAFYVSMLSEKYKRSSLSFVKGVFWGKMTWWKSLNQPEKSSSVIYFMTKL
ncbi:MAG: class I SAM-dependent methyltransferase [Bacteroidales bacterium]|nr:class I SAM-dependent methyltransferase [Bacteroidales bacterium]